MRKGVLLAILFSGNLAADTCGRDGCVEADIEAFEAEETGALRLELLQMKKHIELKQGKTLAVPFWCLEIDDYSRSLTPACNGAAGGCGPCLGPEVCGSAPILPGSWQSYSYACCSCKYVTQQPAAITITPAPPPTSTWPISITAPPVVVTPLPIAPPVVPSAPQVASPSTAAPSATGNSTAVLCSEHPECSKLGLLGNCCPADGGTSLGCCSQILGNSQSQAGAPIAPVLASAETTIPPTTPTPALTAKGVRIPFWCETIDLAYRNTYPACTGAGIEAGGCSCLGQVVCGSGPAIAGTWQSYSSSCCGCS